MNVDINNKIENLLKNGPNISEDQVRSLMALVRKRIESIPETEKLNYLVLKLFGDWSLHNKIDKSNTGLRTIARINDALVQVKDIQDNSEVQIKLSEAIGYVALRREFILFLNNSRLDPAPLQHHDTWGHILTHLIEIIRDVPLTFPPLSELNKAQQKIYDQITKSTLSLGGGVIMMQITKIDYSQVGLKDTGKLMSLHILLENTTNIIVPLLLNVTFI